MNNKYNYTIDSIKLLFAFTVVLMHGLLLDWQVNFNINLVVNGFFRAAVPFFFIASGYLFFSTLARDTTKKWYAHIFKRYLFWITIYLYRLVDTILSDPNMTTAQIIRAVIRYIIIGPDHLWFIPALIMTSAIVLLSKQRLNQMPLKWIIAAMLTLWILGTSINLLANGTFLDGKFYLYRNFLFFGLPMFLSGYLLKKYEPSIMTWLTKTRLNVLLFSSTVLIIAESSLWYFLTKNSTGVTTLSLDMVMFMPFFVITVFLCCIKNNNLNIARGEQRYISMFMYYSHILVLDIIGLLISNAGMQTLVSIVAIITIYYVAKPKVRLLI